MGPEKFCFLEKISKRLKNLRRVGMNEKTGWKIFNMDFFPTFSLSNAMIKRSLVPPVAVDFELTSGDSQRLVVERHSCFAIVAYWFS